MDTSGLFGLWEPPTDGMMPLIEPRAGRTQFNENVPPKQGYEPPTEYTTILGTSALGLDLETYDPDLKTKGPGAHRKDGFVVGVGIGPRPNVQYYPLMHRMENRNIQFKDKYFDILRSEAAEYSGEVIGANLQYDLDWLGRRHKVVFHRARIRDVQIAEPLLDENKLTYKLNKLSTEYLGEGKSTGTLESLYGNDYISNMHKVDAGHASDYCIKDIELAMDVYTKQIPLLQAQGLWDLFDYESRLIPLLLRMRENGVPVDVPRVEQALDALELEKIRVAKRIESLAGCPVDVWSADSIAFAFDRLEIGYPTTAGTETRKGKPSFTKDWLKAHTSEIANLITEKRDYEKIGGTFLKSYILDEHVDGRVYCQFNQLRSDGSGTVSGRFSSSYPNLQNIPTRHPILGPLCRSAFIPEEGMEWGCTDWSQIEFRFLVHYAVRAFNDPSKHPQEAIDSARKAADAYINDPSTDFHKEAAKFANVDRKLAKNINFGVVYGMGVPTMAGNLGKSIEEAAPILDKFHVAMPFLKKIYNLASRQAEKNGYIKTIMNRRRRFDLYEATVYKNNKPEKKFGSEEHLVAWLEEMKQEGLRGKPPRRAHTHKALNALLQGSAADLMKKCMVDIWDAGIFEVLLPHLTVHDELDMSVPKTTEGNDAFNELVNMMSTSMKLEVPVFASASRGINWNEAKGSD